MSSYDIQAEIERAKLAQLVREDMLRWPEGHPCRDCDRLLREHPHADCDAWR